MPIANCKLKIANWKFEGRPAQSSRESPGNERDVQFAIFNLQSFSSFLGVLGERFLAKIAAPKSFPPTETKQWPTTW
jgi:hypothetical protein